MLEGSLNPFYIESTPTNINIRILRVLNAKTESRALITPAFPATRLFGEISLSYRNTNIFIIKKCSIQFEEINKMLAQVYLTTLIKSLLSLQMTHDKHS